MKKWIMFCLVLFISLTLVACNSSKTVILQTEQNGVTMKIAYKADGDRVTEQTADNIMPYESLGVTTAEEAEEILSELVEEYQGLKGITHKIDYQDDKMVESLTINYEEADMDQVSKLTGSQSEGDVSKGVSLKKSVDMLKEQGFEVVE
jgi:uncharacterized lipoprotein YehR (DUF1307 family)